MCWMLVHDSAMVVTSALLFVSSLYFFRLTVKNLKTHANDVVTEQHFFEHAVATAFVSIASLLMLSADVTHLFSIAQSEEVEYMFTAPELLMRIGIAIFMIHMIKEQTPGHQFYIREYGE